MLILNKYFNHNVDGIKNEKSGKKIKLQKSPLSRKLCLVCLLCLTVFLSGCGVSGGGDQITKMDEKYLTQQESESPDGEMEEASSDSGEEKEKDVSSSESDKGEDDKQATKRFSSKEEKKQTSAPKKSSQAKASKNSAKSSTEKKKASKTKNNKKNSASPEKTTASKEKDSSQKENSVSSNQKEEESKKDRDSISCTISIDCKTILSNMSQLKSNKKAYVPKDGVILKKTRVTVAPGSSVYDVLYQVCRDKKIHLEAAYTPMYKTYYVEGIHQLYEFDCGDLSGWNYLVNDVQPNYGCSKYQVKAGDEIAWRFTCDTGKDL